MQSVLNVETTNELGKLNPPLLILPFHGGVKPPLKGDRRANFIDLLYLISFHKQTLPVHGQEYLSICLKKNTKL